MIPSPNIWNHPDVYETENLGVAAHITLALFG